MGTLCGLLLTPLVPAAGPAAGHIRIFHTTWWNMLSHSCSTLLLSLHINAYPSAKALKHSSHPAAELGACQASADFISLSLVASFPNPVGLRFALIDIPRQAVHHPCCSTAMCKHNHN